MHAPSIKICTLIFTQLFYFIVPDIRVTVSSDVSPPNKRRQPGALPEGDTQSGSGPQKRSRCFTPLRITRAVSFCAMITSYIFSTPCRSEDIVVFSDVMMLSLLINLLQLNPSRQSTMTRPQGQLIGAASPWRGGCLFRLLSFSQSVQVGGLSAVLPVTGLFFHSAQAN